MKIADWEFEIGNWYAHTVEGVGSKILQITRCDDPYIYFQDGSHTKVEPGDDMSWLTPIANANLAEEIANAHMVLDEAGVGRTDGTSRLSSLSTRIAELRKLADQLRVELEEVRKNEKFKVGDKVQCDAPNGSVGTILEIRDGLYDVEWIYGLDVNGNAMTAVSRYVKEVRLSKISNTDYQVVATRKGFANA